MRRGPKPAKSKDAKPPVARKSPKSDGARVRDLEKRLAEALKGKVEAQEQQAATAEILQAMRRSPADTQPVFDAIVSAAARLLRADGGILTRVADELIELAAFTSSGPAGDEGLKAGFPVSVHGTGSMQAMTVRGPAPFVSTDFGTDERLNEGTRRRLAARGFRSGAAVPLIDKGISIGALSVTRRDPGAFAPGEIALLQTFADQAVIAIENVRLFNETKEALEQQTATSEILRIISSSPTDLQPVLDAVSENAARVCEASDAEILLVEGTQLRAAAHHGQAFAAAVDRPVTRDGVAGRAVIDRATIHLPDVLVADDFPLAQRLSRADGSRTVLATPLIREAVAVGAILIRREEVRPFSDKQIALLQTFADQAVIAIENVRLFTELQTSNRDLTEALDQQTATSEILRAISSSPTDLQPVLNTIAINAVRVCGAYDATVLLREGEFVRRVAHHGPLPSGREDLVPINRSFVSNRTIIDSKPVHLQDVLAPEGSDFSDSRESAQRVGFRTILSVPLLHEGSAIGALNIRRREVRPFSDSQVTLLQTFADQAVIAIENVRLFTELQQKNEALTQAHAKVTESLEQQTATGEILRVISQSPTDVQPVLDAIVTTAVRLCDGVISAAFLVSGDQVEMVAHHNFTESGLAAMRSQWPRPVTPDTITGRAILERQVVHVREVETDADIPLSSREVAKSVGYRSLVAVPMIREGRCIGSINVSRPTSPFTDQQIALLQTFADQAVIAIENVRLFNETKEALDQQTATAEILGVISSSPTDVQPVFTALAISAARLCDAFDAAIHRMDGDVLRLVAHDGPIEPDALLPLQRGTLAGQVVRERRAIQVGDMQAETHAYPLSSEFARNRGFRTILCVPLLREAEVLGTITIRRTEVRLFTHKQAELLRTFADQAVIAIENVRLFKELQESNRELTTALDTQTATSDILRVISRSPTDVQPVFDTIVRNAVRLCDAIYGTVYRSDDTLIHSVAYHNLTSEQIEQGQRTFPRPLSDRGATARAIRTRTVVRVADLEAEPDVVPADMGAQMRARGVRSVLIVPMLRQQQAIGSINLTHREVGAFTDAHVELLQTFADQAVIAIENARLFKELEARNNDLTATGEILRVIASSPTDLQPAFNVIASSALRLCSGVASLVFRYDGRLIHLAASDSAEGIDLEVIRHNFPAPPEGATFASRVVTMARPLYIADIERDPDAPPGLVEFARANSFRSIFAAPMRREDQTIGLIAVIHRDVGGFTSEQGALLQTFADQAVIAIENVRLFTETKEALEQQTATAEILRVISQSPTDVQPVFETIVRNAVRLCGAIHGGVYRFDGELIHSIAHEGFTPEQLEDWRRHFPRPITAAGTGNIARAIATRSVEKIADVEAADLGADFVANLRARGVRSTLSVPMLRRHEVIGVIGLTHRAVDGFSDAHVELLKTFADQAVIAIENVRLFKELEARTSELTRSVDQLTALGEVGRAVSSTLDLQTVLNTVVARAVELSAGSGGLIYEYEETKQEFDLIRGSHHLDDEMAQLIRATPIRLGEGVAGKAAALRVPVQVPDVLDDRAYDVARIRTVFQRRGYRSLLAVPLLLEQQIIGVLVVWRPEPGHFPPEVVSLLQTFGTQSALAIQNARLFRELADKSRQLEVASQHKSEFLANMSHELRTPLNAIIGFSEVLTERMFGDLNEKQEEYLKDIYASGTHLLSLINDILDLSKIEAGRMELELTDFHLPAALDSALTLVRERAGRRSITLQMSVDERLGEIRADERKIRQVVLNLLSNAIKFTPEGGRIEVAAVPKDGSVEVSVSDTGVGIAPEDQEAVFEEFRQVGTAEKKAEGTGLGLTLCRKFIELHGGRIWVQSQVGVGSTFTFRLPVHYGE